MKIPSPDMTRLVAALLLGPLLSRSASLPMVAELGGKVRQTRQVVARGEQEGGLFGVISRGIRSRVILLLFHWSD